MNKSKLKATDTKYKSLMKLFKNTAEMHEKEEKF